MMIRLLKAVVMNERALCTTITYADLCNLIQESGDQTIGTMYITQFHYRFNWN